MKTLKQLARQRLKTLLGVLLMTLAAAILCVTAGQQRRIRRKIPHPNHREIGLQCGGFSFLCCRRLLAGSL